MKPNNQKDDDEADGPEFASMIASFYGAFGFVIPMLFYEIECVFRTKVIIIAVAFGLIVAIVFFPALLGAFKKTKNCIAMVGLFFSLGVAGCMIAFVVCAPVAIAPSWNSLFIAIISGAVAALISYKLVRVA